MNKVRLLTGRVLFWVTLPGLFIYLLNSKRTRVLVWVDDEFLVVKSWLGSGNWQLPGGGMHSGELSVTGALRELREETGLLLTEDDLTLLQADVRSRGWFRFRFDVYEAQLPQKPTVKLQAGELVDYAWLPLASNDESLTADTAQALERWKFQR